MDVAAQVFEQAKGCGLISVRSRLDTLRLVKLIFGHFRLMLLASRPIYTFPWPLKDALAEESNYTKSPIDLKGIPVTDGKKDHRLL